MISRRNFLTTSMLTSAAAMTTRHPLFAAQTPPVAATSGLRFGVNFTPRKRWWYCWLDWDKQAIADDLSGIASLGLDHIRIQCLWPLFQPGINTVSDRLLDNLHSLLAAAADVGLDVEVTVLNGWMSGLSFLPPWVMPLARPQNGDNFNIFSSATVIEAEKLLFRRIAETVGGHRRFLGFDLGNELGVLMGMNNPVATNDADKWATDMLSYCDQIAPGKFHVNGTDHSHWFNDFGFSRPTLANTGHATVTHTYIYFDGVLGRYKYSDQASLHLADYMVELAYAYQKDLNRKVWTEEIGVSSKEMPTDFQPEYMDHQIRNIAATGKSWGVTWWSSHDIDPANKSFDYYEYELGLLDLENRPKPLGKKLKELAAELGHSQQGISPRTTALVIPDTGLSTKPWPPDWRFAKVYMDLIDKGKTPCIVLQSRLRDEGYLRARGIRDVIPCAC
ncbi:MAG: hypothetical protein ABSF28_04715 [Terracidiphilus sp.]|jgi:hypothetical protein